MAAHEIGGTGRYSVRVVGESFYQDALEDVVGGRQPYSAWHHCEATLTCEDNHPHDPLAVAVRFKGRVVGYLAAADAPKWRRFIADLGWSKDDVRCAAIVTGGWDRGEDDRGYFGVRLDLPGFRRRASDGIAKTKVASPSRLTPDRQQQRKKSVAVPSDDQGCVILVVVAMVVVIAFILFGWRK